ncbi:CHAT domain-containing protein [Actinoplanes sp. NPDC051411]|uniref:CHAT domain-containing protein n=1 Tax=Actinoplanes sp. NPDC051411 TaxID=3155522 RepID=UPI00343944A2
MGEQDEVATLHAAIDATAGLRGHFWRALARSTPVDANEAAQAAAADADDLARDRLAAGDAEGALRVLESARGLALYAATEIRPVADHLAAAGKPDLARQWQAAAAVPDPHHLPAELRRNVLTTLLTRSPAAGLLGPATIAEIQSALAATDADALVHLLPRHAIVVPAAGRATHLPLPALTPASDHIERFLATLALHNAIATAPGRPPADIPDTDLTTALHDLCRWAWDAVVGPLLDHLMSTRFPGAAPLPLPALGGRPSRRHVPRIVLVAPGDLARVPWAAARRGDGAYAIELMAISQAVSARMLCRNAARPATPPASTGLIVADPDTDGHARELPSARFEAYAISRTLLPQARLTGRRPDGTASPSGAGTLDQIRAWLATSNPDAGGLLHLACTGFARPGGEAYALMAGGERLTATEILALRGRAQRRPLELVVLAGGRTGLSVTGYDEAFGLGTAFLAGGARSVLATRWTVPEAAAPALLFMTHLLRQSGRPVWSALRAAQLWMLDPGREVPPSMPAELADAVGRTDPAKAIAWAAVTHWGH